MLTGDSAARMSDPLNAFWCHAFFLTWPGMQCIAGNYSFKQDPADRKASLRALLEIKTPDIKDPDARAYLRKEETFMSFEIAALVDTFIATSAWGKVEARAAQEAQKFYNSRLAKYQAFFKGLDFHEIMLESVMNWLDAAFPEPRDATEADSNGDDIPLSEAAAAAAAAFQARRSAPRAAGGGGGAGLGQPAARNAAGRAARDESGSAAGAAGGAAAATAADGGSAAAAAGDAAATAAAAAAAAVARPAAAAEPRVMSVALATPVQAPAAGQRGRRTTT